MNDNPIIPKDKLVIFDFDGTISDSLPLFISVAKELVQDGELRSFSAQDVIRWQSMLPRDVIAELEIPWYKIPWLLFKARRKLNHSHHTVTLFAGMKECVQTVSSHYPTIIISTNSKQFIKKVLTKHGISDQIAIVGGGALFGKHKKINSALQKYRVRPENAVLITDEVRDLEAAQKSLVHAIAVTWGFQSRAILSTLAPAALVDAPNDILPEIQTLLS